MIPDGIRWTPGNVHYIRLHKANMAEQNSFETERRRHQKSKIGDTSGLKIGHVNVYQTFKK